ncbi:DNA-binding response regulator [Planobispora rosea]|uniref:DNA-binding response regulator n=1 Tax=Planobispora rosea TaxID=35762 RepID=A0A8J3S9Q9_PLARO|nr:response regulator transcription factor [Planobispora rosea]GGT05906.1 DNA-binding response regulator [Planobispora rosea]GIH88660.1 DNA-binding response regulator [Planobispora rosea]
MTDEQVSVLVVDDQGLIRESIASLLGIQPGITVLGTAADGRDAVEKTVELGPDVVLMDVRMPVMDGIRAVAELRRRAPACRVVMLTTFDDEEYVVEALRAGAAGYLLKDLPARELAAAVRLAHAGVVQFDPAATARLATALSRSAPASPRGPVDPASAARAVNPGTLPSTPPSTPPSPGDSSRPGSSAGPGADLGLTGREIEVLRLVARGSTNREIAERLYLSEGTVKNHISRILGRLGLRDRTQAAIYARDRGLL